MDVLNIIDMWDFILVPIYFGLIMFVAYYIKNKYISRYPEFKYFTWGLAVKCLGSMAFGLIYVFYYGGGDTTNYYKGAVALANLASLNFQGFWDILVNNELSWEAYCLFTPETGYPPWYMWKDPGTFSVSRFSSLFAIIGFNSFWVMGILAACFSYIGIWKLYRLFNMIYPGYSKGFGWSILFLPSLVFWGSGIMKDTFVLGAVCWVTMNFYQVFIKRKDLAINLFLLVMNVTIIISMKPYVLLSLFPGMLFWLYSSYMKKITHPLLKTIALPILVVVIGMMGYFAFSNLSSTMGVYGDVDSAVKQAQTIQQDLLREEQYGGNNYYLGEIDGSIGNMLKLAPIAIFTSLYRPMFWEIGSPTMVISAIENTILLVISLVLLFSVNPMKYIRIIFSEPVLVYSLVFTLFLAFGVGIASTNFGALVRYKIPLIPFFYPMLYVVFIKSKTKRLRSK